MVHRYELLPVAQHCPECQNSAATALFWVRLTGLMCVIRRLASDDSFKWPFSCYCMPHEQESPNEEANENDDESGETPDKPDDEDHEMEERDAS